jgi:hypothetical protein
VPYFLFSHPRLHCAGMIQYHSVRIGMTAESILKQIALTERGQVSRAEDIFIYDRINSTWVVLFDLILRAENLFTRRNRLLLSKAREMERA